MNQAAIRQFAGADTNAVVNLIADFIAEGRRKPVERPAIADAVGAFPSERGQIYVAELGGQIVGYLAVHWIPFPMIQAWEAYISDLIVSQPARGTGIGGQLLTSVEAAARERGCRRLMLNNRTNSESFARAFYPKRGFRHRDDFANFVKDL